MNAFATPIVPGKLDVFESFCEEMKGDRAADFAAFNERHGLTTHQAYLQQTPDGNHLAVIVVDGPGAETFPHSVMEAADPADGWFGEAIADIHGIDLSAPPPPPTVRKL